jgi:polar amino acid transport system substrate-binding protein
MKKLALSLTALAFGAMTAFAQDVVRMGTEGAYPPYNFINDNNELDGFEIEFGNAMCERAGLTCEWVINDWDTIIPISSQATTTPSSPACRSPRRGRK